MIRFLIVGALALTMVHEGLAAYSVVTAQAKPGAALLSSTTR